MTASFQHHIQKSLPVFFRKNFLLMSVAFYFSVSYSPNVYANYLYPGSALNWTGTNFISAEQTSKFSYSANQNRVTVSVRDWESGRGAFSNTVKSANSASASDIVATSDYFITDSRFVHNNSTYSGAAMTLWHVGDKNTTSITNNISNSIFIENTAVLGGAIATLTINNFFVQGMTSLSDVSFIKNTSTGTGLSFEGGGALFFENENVVIENAKFIENKSNTYGGAILGRSGTSIELKGDFVLFGNKSKNGGSEFLNNDIYLNSATDNQVLSFSNEAGSVGLIEGGVYTTGNTSITKSGAGTLIFADASQNTYSEKSGYNPTFKQTDGLVIARSENFNLASEHLINGGELKTHGAEINYQAVVGEDAQTKTVGTLSHYTTKDEMEIGSSVTDAVSFGATDLGAKICFGTYTLSEQAKELGYLSDEKIEYENSLGEKISIDVKDLLYKIEARADGHLSKFIVTKALTNESGNIIAFRNGQVEIDSSIGNTGAIYEFDNSVLLTSNIQNKVLSNNMKLKDDISEYSFSEIKIKENTSFDIENKKVRADSIVFGNDSTLKVTLNDLNDYGTLIYNNIEGDETANLELKLTNGLEQESGIYQVFSKDNQLTLMDNNLFDIQDLGDGSYKIEKKESNTIENDMEIKENEARVLDALMQGNNFEHQTFRLMQEEVLEALQSDDAKMVGKAKKALKAIGGTEQPAAQSLAMGHFNELQRVISQMAMEKEAEVGRAGGEEAPRAKVVMKGLYDKTKSTMGEGFKAYSKGAVLGVQSKVTDALTVGVGYATSQTTAKEELRRTEADVNTGFISAHYQPNAWWVSGMAMVSRGQYDEEKQILSSKGTANYDVDSWGAQVMTGYDIKLDNMVVTPEIGLRYLTVKQESYTDTLGTTVDGVTSNYLTALMGAKASWDLGKIRPTVGVSVGYDVVTDDVNTLNTLANGASYTVTGEALDRLSATITTGLEAKVSDRTSLKLEYSGSFRKEYQDHSGMLKFELRF